MFDCGCSPLHLDKISTPISCQQTHTRVRMHRDIAIACLFEENANLMMSMINNAAPRMASICGSGPAKATMEELVARAQESTEHCQVVFLAMLNMDIEMKKELITGIAEYRLAGITPQKAALFYTYLEKEVLLPWITDESVSNQDLIALAKQNYLVA